MNDIAHQSVRNDFRSDVMNWMNPSTQTDSEQSGNGGVSLLSVLKSLQNEKDPKKIKDKIDILESILVAAGTYMAQDKPQRGPGQMVDIGGGYQRYVPGMKPQDNRLGKAIAAGLGNVAQQGAEIRKSQQLQNISDIESKGRLSQELIKQIGGLEKENVQQRGAQAGRVYTEGQQNIRSANEIASRERIAGMKPPDKYGETKNYMRDGKPFVGRENLATGEIEPVKGLQPYEPQKAPPDKYGEPKSFMENGVPVVKRENRATGALETVPGLQPMPTGASVTLDKDGNLTVSSGGVLREDMKPIFSEKTLGMLDENIVESKKILSNLDRIKSLVDPEFLTLEGKLRGGWYDAIDQSSTLKKFAGDLTPEQANYLGRQEKFNTAVGRTRDDYRRLITGAAGALRELDDIASHVISEKKGSVRFNAALAEWTSELNRMDRLLIRMRREGGARAGRFDPDRFDSLFTTDQDDNIEDRLAELISEGNTEEQAFIKLRQEGYR